MRHQRSATKIRHQRSATKIRHQNHVQHWVFPQPAEVENTGIERYGGPPTGKTLESA
jgi:hypothetical protein